MSIYNNNTIVKMAKCLPGTASELAKRIGIQDQSVINSIGMVTDQSWGSFRMEHSGQRLISATGDKQIKISPVFRNTQGIVSVFSLPRVPRTALFTRASVVNITVGKNRQFITADPWIETTTTFTTNVDNSWRNSNYGKYRLTLNKTSGVLVMEFKPKRRYEDFETIEFEIKLGFVELNSVND